MSERTRFVEKAELYCGESGTENYVHVGTIRNVTIKETFADPLPQDDTFVYSGKSPYKRGTTRPECCTPKICAEHMQIGRELVALKRFAKRPHVYRDHGAAWCGARSEDVQNMHFRTDVPAHAGYCAHCRAAFRRQKR